MAIVRCDAELDALFGSGTGFFLFRRTLDINRQIGEKPHAPFFMRWPSASHAARRGEDIDSQAAQPARDSRFGLHRTAATQGVETRLMCEINLLGVGRVLL